MEQLSWREDKSDNGEEWTDFMHIGKGEEVVSGWSP